MDDTDIYKAGGIIIQHRKLLFARSKHTENFIDPGGRIEPGETPTEALVRELNEELSIDVDEADLEFFGEFSAEAANHPGRVVHMEVYMVKGWRGEIVASSEIEELQWITSDTVSSFKVGSIFGGQVLPLLKEKGMID